MTGPVLRIGHGNGHNRPALVEWVRDADAHSHGCDEAQLLLKSLEALKGRRVTVAGDDYAEAKHSSGRVHNRHQSSAIVTRSSCTSLGELVVQVSDRIPGHSEVAPDRFLLGSLYRHPVATALDKRGVAHLHVHPDAAVAKADRDSELVDAYLDALRATRGIARALRRMGFLIVVTGDLQVDETFDRPWGPVPMLADPLNLKHRTVNIDWLLFDHRLNLADWHTRRLFDHTGFLAELVAK